jgi:hypothetical protein
MSVQRARELVLKYGWNATAYQIVNPGITHWFSPSGDAMIGYVRKCGVRVVAGSPVCEKGQLPKVLSEWEADAKTAGDKTCYFGAADRLKDLLEASQEYSTVSLGSQPVWDPSNWDSIICSHSSLRAQLSRARNKGVTVSEWHEDRATQNPELRRVLDEFAHVALFGGAGNIIADERPARFCGGATWARCGIYCALSDYQSQRLAHRTIPARLRRAKWHGGIIDGHRNSHRRFRRREIYHNGIGASFAKRPAGRRGKSRVVKSTFSMGARARTAIL